MTIQFNNLPAGDDLAGLLLTGLYIAPLRDMAEEGQDGTQFEMCAAEEAQVWGLYGCVASGDHVAMHDADDVADLVKLAVTVMDQLTICLGYWDTKRRVDCVGLQELCERLTELIHDEIPGYDEIADFQEDDFDSHPITRLREALCEACEYNGPVDAFGGDNHGDDISAVALDEAERATIIAALRYWQSMGGNSQTESQQTYAETTALIGRLKEVE